MHKNFNLYKLNPGCLPYTQKFQFVKIRPRLFAYTKIKKKYFDIFFGGRDSWGLRPMLQWGSPTPITGFCFKKIKKKNFGSGEFFYFWGGWGVPPPKKIA